MELDLFKNGIGNKVLNVVNDQSFTMSNESKNIHNFKFDKIFDDGDQADLFDYLGKETIEDVIKGYNGTIFTYGQSGSGKTYSMYGSTIYDPVRKGIIPRAM